MKISRPADFPMSSPRSALVERLRSYWGGRRGLLVLGGAALTLGIGLNWGWLAAAGVTPFLLAMLPCAAMCALGLCMKRPADTPEAARDIKMQASPVASPARLQLTSSEALTQSLDRQPVTVSAKPGCCHTFETQENCNAKNN